MSDAPWQLQTAIYTVLTGNSTLTALADIYDHTPLNGSLPYLSIGQGEAYDWSTKTFDGHRHHFDIHIWSNYRGTKELHEIAAEVTATLHNASLTVTGHTLVLIQFEKSRVMEDIGGQTHHGILEFRALTQGT